MNQDLTNEIKQIQTLGSSKVTASGSSVLCPKVLIGSYKLGLGVRKRAAEEQIRGRLHPWQQRAVHLHSEAQMIIMRRVTFVRQTFPGFSQYFPLRRISVIFFYSPIFEQH